MAKGSNHQAFIFFADTRFERMARRAGAAPREEALAAAQAHVDEMKVDFNEWLEAELQNLAIMLTKIEINPADSDRVERADHHSSQLRDIGTTMGFELVTFVASSLCTILQTIKAGGIYDKNMVECHINALHLARTEPYRMMSPAEVPEMSSGLRRIVELVIETAPDDALELNDQYRADAIPCEKRQPPLTGGR